VTDSTGFTPIELLNQAKKPDLYEKILTKSPENLPELETIGDKVEDICKDEEESKRPYGTEKDGKQDVGTSGEPKGSCEGIGVPRGEGGWEVQTPPPPPPPSALPQHSLKK